MKLIILNLTNPEIRKNYKWQIITDHYGRKVPKHAILKGMNLQEGATAGQPFPSAVQFYDAVLTLCFFLTVSLYNCTLKCFHHGW